jgi:amidase
MLSFMVPLFRLGSIGVLLLQSLHTKSAVELAAAIRAKQVSAREVVTAFLDQIEKLNPDHNAIVSLRPRAEILADAEACDSRIPQGALFGLPIAIKDLAQTKGLRTTFGSPIYKDFVPAQDDLHVARIRAAGAIIIAKTNVPEWGFGSQTYNPVFGATRNAFDRSLTAGGSSGGAAVALALNMVPLADGSDMGGSLRNPAAFNNVYGFRPSQGRVPAYPSSDLFMTQMAIEGPMGRTVDDVALLLSVQAGRDDRVPLSLAGAGAAFAPPLVPAAKGKRIAWLGDLNGALPMEPGVLEICQAGLICLQRVGANVENFVPVFDYELLWQAFKVLRQFSAGGGLVAHYNNPAERALLKPEAVWEIEQFLKLSAHDVFEASVVRSQWYECIIKCFERYDFITMPTAQVFPFPVEQHWPQLVNGVSMDTYHRWMQIVSLGTMSGCPIMSVPVGFSGKRSMGMQIMGRPQDDLGVLRMASAYELNWTHN